MQTKFEVKITPENCDNFDGAIVVWGNDDGFFSAEWVNSYDLAQDEESDEKQIHRVWSMEDLDYPQPNEYMAKINLDGLSRDEIFLYQD